MPGKRKSKTKERQVKKGVKKAKQTEPESQGKKDEDKDTIKWKTRLGKLVEELVVHSKQYIPELTTFEKEQLIDDALVAKDLVTTSVWISAPPTEFDTNPLEDVSVFRTKHFDETGLKHHPGHFTLHLPETNRNGTGIFDMCRVKEEANDDTEKEESSENDNV
jgi:hypothetical protein